MSGAATRSRAVFRCQRLNRLANRHGGGKDAATRPDEARQDAHASVSQMTGPQDDPQRLTLLERALVRTIFASRWFLAPFYLGLSIALIVLLVEFARGIVHLVAGLAAAGHDEVVIGVLSLIEQSLMANLVLMVMFAGYENFVSRLAVDDHRDRPAWIDKLGYGDLKLKLLASIVAIAAIQVLEDFMDLAHTSDRDLAWRAGLYLLFIASAVLFAVMDRISHR
jgi:uncharacterized protein (TIGR00645 family)